MKKYEGQRGQTLPLVAMGIALLVATAGFAVDAGYHQYHQRMQQTATDSAALAGAQELLVGDWLAAARKDASNNGYADNTGQNTCPVNPAVGTVCVVVQNPPPNTDAYSGNAQAVEVDITAYHPTFFESVFDINNVPVSTKAVAVLTTAASPNCMYVLSGSANFNAGQNGGTLSAPNCGLVFNGGANFNNATVNAKAISCAATCSNGTFSGAQPKTTAPASDPCPQMSNCAYLAAHPPTTCSTNLTAGNNQNIIVPSGCYNNLDLHKANSVTFDCGLYVISGSLNASASGNNSVITINQQSGCGVTFYVTGSGSVNMRNANINLAAPTSGDYTQYSAGEQNILFYQDSADSNPLVLQSASCQTCSAQLSGMIYAPTANLNYNQGASANTGTIMIVAGSLNYNGTTTSLFGVPTGPGGSPSIAVLGE